MDSATWGEKVASASKVFKPSGPGPFPVALILHGCGGKTPFLETYAQVAVQAGYAAVVVDSLKPRGMSTLDAKLFVCTGVALQGLKRSADLFAMLAWLEGQAWADTSRVFLAGWSHGGWTIMDGYAVGSGAARATGLADADPARLRASVRGVLLVYPYAGYPSLTSSRGWSGPVPRVWSVLAGKDQVVGWKHPKKALDRLSGDGLAVDTVFLPDATHAYDDDRANDPRAKYRPDLFGQTRDYFAKALTEALRG
ncbi:MULTISPECIES: dienelactone hydrolase family protein [unclassified Caulobacter]|uniref:dienelactone hydrolase family protein n=1 Tax=unclassified Caulobacter TaxID=2648921 RepID=UPI000D3B554F|nr:MULTISPECIES: prolyl oligopeptidase family serine peptidase [unclassified Caulobacter]PTS90782.1 dienelactone hydrolase [Caulobacter sp. HMWF009]PTT09780.1 dienelactone hydrolase [Caulobacter sp. HMWF025]